MEDLYELHQYIQVGGGVFNLSITVACSILWKCSNEDEFSFQEAAQRENLLKTKLLALQGMFNNIKEAANEGWKALICEDRLLTRVEALENQLQAYSKV